MSETEMQIRKQNSFILDGSQRNLVSQLCQKPVEIKYQNFKALMLKTCILSLQTFNFGYCLVEISTLSKNTMIEYFGQQTQNPVVSSFLIVTITLCAAVGAFMSPFFMKCFTRRNIVLIFNIGLLIITGIIQIPNLYVLFVCRGIQGFIFGNIMAIVPVHVNELSPKQVVRISGMLATIFIGFGVVSAYLLGIVLTKAGVSKAAMWRIMFGFDILLTVIVILNCLCGFIPESPNSLIIKGEQEQAKRVINLFIKDEYVEEVFKQKQLQVEYELNIKKNQEEETLNYSKKAYLVGFLLPTMQQFTGITPVATVIGSILCLIVAPIINSKVGSFAIFFIFGGITLIIGVINLFIIVQIKGLNVKQICEAYQ